MIFKNTVSRYAFVIIFSLPCVAVAFHKALTLETERCILRELTIEDAEVLFVLGSDSQVLMYTVLGSSAFDSIDQTYSYIEHKLKLYKDGAVIPWAIIEKSTGNTIGYVQLFDHNSVHKKAEIGYFLMPTYWNKGIGTEITKAVISYAFMHLNVVRLQIACDPRNIGSARIIEKCGFRYEGLLRNFYIMHGLRCDRSVYSMTDEEFRQLYQ